jgi:molybdenum cofactor biosynthesis enzyme MoaA
MALRLLPDGTLQTCLKRDDGCLDFIGALRTGHDEAVQVAKNALSEFASAKRIDFADIERLRATQSAMAISI